MTGVYEASAGGVPVLHAIAISDTPLTAQELTERLDGADHETVKDTLLRLYRSEYVVRQKRDTGKPHQHPWEYEIKDGDNL